MEHIKSIYLFVTLISVVITDQTCDHTRCSGSQKLYKEIGCRPVTVEGQCCPVKYECSDFTKLESTKCHFQNNVYAVKSNLPMSITEPLCSASCTCMEASSYGSASFQCAQIECPEVFNREPDCIYPVEEGKCCAASKVCGDDRKALENCYLNGREYYEGETMYPDRELCYTCKCTKDFNNNTITGNPLCSEINCGIQLRYMPELQKGCVPIYYKVESCCPIGWRCPEASDLIVAKDNKEQQSENTCKFRKLSLKVGDELNSVESGVTCTCVVPPFIQCIRKN